MLSMVPAAATLEQPCYRLNVMQCQFKMQVEVLN